MRVQAIDPNLTEHPCQRARAEREREREIFETLRERERLRFA